tara:strand:+ start:701 stop:1645 length:945 start_codon:yes stop_codon:yes gene_type:complete
MRVGVIGYKRHAEKHINLIRNNYPQANLIIYHPNKKLEQITNIFEDILVSDFIIISSPTDTHIFYIKQLALKNFRGSIYLEKPGFNSIQESYELEKIQAKFSLRITIGYHFPFETKIKKLKEIIDEKNTGELISIDITMSKGIAYRDWFINDWRKKDNLSICHTGLSHTLSIFHFLTSQNIIKKNIGTKIIFNKETEAYDTAFAFSKINKPIFKALFSWGSPLIDCKINILSTNKLINLENNNITVRSPRDTFDENNHFLPPEITYSEDFSNEGIKPAVLNFLEQSYALEKFDEKSFKNSINIGRLCLNPEIIN